MASPRFLFRGPLPLHLAAPASQTGAKRKSHTTHTSDTVAEILHQSPKNPRSQETPSPGPPVCFISVVKKWQTRAVGWPARKGGPKPSIYRLYTASLQVDEKVQKKRPKPSMYHFPTKKSKSGGWVSVFQGCATVTARVPATGYCSTLAVRLPLTSHPRARLDGIACSWSSSFSSVSALQRRQPTRSLNVNWVPGAPLCPGWGGSGSNCPNILANGSNHSNLRNPAVILSHTRVGLQSQTQKPGPHVLRCQPPCAQKAGCAHLRTPRRSCAAASAASLSCRARLFGFDLRQAA